MKKIKLISICFSASLFLWSCTAPNTNFSSEGPKDKNSLAAKQNPIIQVSRGYRVDKTKTPGATKLKVVDIPALEKPKAVITNIEEPKAEASKAEAPKAEAPQAEASKAEAPQALAPKALAPKAEAPITEKPDSGAAKDQESAKDANQNNDQEETIKITGSNSFVKQVQEALNLLNEKDLEAFQKVNKYLSKIVENDNSGVDVYSKTFFLGKGTVADSDVYWLAGVIVHDAYHSELYSLNKPFTGAEAETACNQRQKAVLRIIGAPEHYLTYLDEVSESQYWEVPFEQRGW